MIGFLKLNKIMGFALLVLLSSTVFSQKITELNIKHKISPHIKLNTLKSLSGKCRLQVRDVRVFEKWVKINRVKVDYVRTRFNNIIHLSGIEERYIKELLEQDNTIYLDLADRAAIDEVYIDGMDLSLNQVNLVHHQYPSIKGKGLVVSVKENPFDTLDIDLRNRILTPSKGIGDYTAHATMMATIIAGAGNTGSKGLGVAPEATMVTASYQSLLPDDLDTLVIEGVSVQNHSYGVGEVENYYGIEAHLYDKQSQLQPRLLHVFSSGNIGTTVSEIGPYSGIPKFANLTGQFKNAKNPICVGSLDKHMIVHKLSSKGPAYDGRIKPEVAAYGANGTSDAAALVSGICILVQDAYRQKYHELPPSSLVKAFVINGATDIGTKGPDFSSGFGLVNAQAAIGSVMDSTFFLGSLKQAEVVEYNMEIPENTSNIKFTLVWNDPSAQAGAVKTLQNNLDLVLTHLASGTKYHPWVLNHHPSLDSLLQAATRKIDTLNNVEQISIENPKSGTYQISVHGNGISNDSQAYSLVYRLEKEGFEWEFPTSSDLLEADKPYHLRWNWKGGDSLASLDYKLVDGFSWVALTDAVSLSQGYFSWNGLDKNTRVNFRIKRDGATYYSDTVVVSQALRLKVGFNCSQNLLLNWPKTDGVENYTLWQLNGRYLEKVIQTPDTFALLNKSSFSSKHYAVSTFVDGTDGVKGYTLDYRNQGSGCYIKSFYPLKAVTNKVKLQLNLGSTYKVKSVVLERLDDNISTEIGKIDQVQTTDMVLEDKAPKTGANVYQVRIDTDLGAPVYSQKETVFYATKNNISVYPNPVYKDVVRIITTLETVEATLYNLYGAEIMHYPELTGQIKTIDVSGLKPGVYLVKISQKGRSKALIKINVVR